MLGCEGSGKTLLCRQLERWCSSAAAATAQAIDSKTVPSVGVELLELLHGNRRFSVREVGGVMQPVWYRYFEGCSAVVFVADSSSAAAASSASIEWYNLLAARALRGTPTLLLLNKRDHPTALPQPTLQLLLRTPECELHMRGLPVAMLSISALTGEGMGSFLEWIGGALSRASA